MSSLKLPLITESRIMLSKRIDLENEKMFMFVGVTMNSTSLNGL